VAIVPFQTFADSSHAALLRDSNARTAPCILLNLPLRLAAVSCTLQWTLGAEIKKQL